MNRIILNKYQLYYLKNKDYLIEVIKYMIFNVFL
jgi:hypothetical protein